MARCFSGRRLREKRIAAGKCPEELAVAIGRSFYSLDGYERGRVTPSTTVLIKLAAVLDCRVDDLLADEREVTGAA